jgi:hypothetical protein
MFTTSHPNFLRHVLWADAVASAATGLVMIAGAGALESLLGLPSALTREAGLVLMPFAALVAIVATRARISRAAVWTIIAANAAWTIGSFGLSFGLLAGGVATTTLGYAFVIAQALAVAILAELEYAGLRALTAAQAA